MSHLTTPYHTPHAKSIFERRKTHFFSQNILILETTKENSFGHERIQKKLEKNSLTKTSSVLQMKHFRMDGRAFWCCYLLNLHSYYWWFSHKFRSHFSLLHQIFLVQFSRSSEPLKTLTTCTVNIQQHSHNFCRNELDLFSGNQTKKKQKQKKIIFFPLRINLQKYSSGINFSKTKVINREWVMCCDVVKTRPFIIIFIDTQSSLCINTFHSIDSHATHN